MPASFDQLEKSDQLRHSGAPKANPESMGFDRVATNRNPMDSRLRGNDGAMRPVCSID